MALQTFHFLPDTEKERDSRKQEAAVEMKPRLLLSSVHNRNNEVFYPL